MHGTLSESVSNQSRLRNPLRVGAISYLNTKPLIWGLDQVEGLELEMSVPSGLLDGFAAGRFDVGLFPAIDYQRRDDLILVPSGGIGCDGPTLTVRIFSTCPIGRINTLACDTDSHTSVALARIILAESFGIRPRFLELGNGTGPATDARLLIGDKVVCEEPAGYGHQLDLGEAWRRLTGLPFLFACWMARRGVDLGDLPRRLEEAKRQGLANARRIADSYAVRRGWPAEMAMQYLTVNLKYDVGPRQLEAMSLFHHKAGEHGLLESEPRPLEMYDSPSAAA